MNTAQKVAMVTLSIIILFFVGIISFVAISQMTRDEKVYTLTQSEIDDIEDGVVSVITHDRLKEENAKLRYEIIRLKYGNKTEQPTFTLTPRPESSQQSSTCDDPRHGAGFGVVICGDDIYTFIHGKIEK